jgi:MFS family permease
MFFGNCSFQHSRISGRGRQDRARAPPRRVLWHAPTAGRAADICAGRATEALGLPASVAGVYLAVRALAGALSNVLWGRVSERQGNRRLLLIAGLLIALTPALALLGPILARGLGLAEVGLSAAIGLVFLVSGVANDGSNIAGMTYLLEIVPEDERPTYMGLANTTLGLVTFLPVLGGWLVGLVGYEGAFAIGLIFSLLGLASTYPLLEADATLARRGRQTGKPAR